MSRWIRTSFVVTAFATAAPASAVPTLPPGAGHGVWRGASVCPLYWSPGSPVVPVPHPQPPPVEPGGRLLETSGAGALGEARGWIEVGRPADALSALAAAPVDDPRTRLYRLAALAGLRRWPELFAALETTP